MWSQSRTTIIIIYAWRQSRLTILQFQFSRDINKRQINVSWCHTRDAHLCFYQYRAGQLPDEVSRSPIKSEKDAEPRNRYYCGRFKPTGVSKVRGISTISNRGETRSLECYAATMLTTKTQQVLPLPLRTTTYLCLPPLSAETGFSACSEATMYERQNVVLLRCGI